MAQKPPHVFAHHSPPKTKEELEQCWLNVRSLLQRDTPWNEEALGLYYRTLCIPPMYALTGVERLVQVLDLATMQALNPSVQPVLAQAMDLATRAGTCATLLYRRSSAELYAEQLSQQEWAQAHFLNSVVNAAHRAEPKTNDDLRCMAIGATMRGGAGAPNRNWPVLIKDDPRWSQAAPAAEQSGLMVQYPQTRQYLDPFMLLCQLVPPLQALHRLWYPSPEAGSTLSLPGGFDCPS